MLDASVALSWCLPLEMTEETLKVHELAVLRGAIVPSPWHIEMANILGVKRRKGEINDATLANVEDLFHSKRIETDHREVATADLLPLVAKFGLTAYDAIYLELALRFQLPIATTDRKLSEARASSGLPVLIELVS